MLAATMKIRAARFNSYLCLLALALAGGCQSPEKSERALLQVHLEVNPDGTQSNGPVQVSRSNPFTVNIEKRPFLHDGMLEEASLVEDQGGVQILLQFNSRGRLLLEQYSLASRGKRAVVFCQFGGEARWLAAPVMKQRISDGKLAFAPDATREEAERIVRDLGNTIRQGKKDQI